MSETPEQTEDQPTITDEAAFCRALGIDPDHVKAGSINVEFTNGQALLTFTSIYAVPPRALGLALLAAAPHEEAPEEAPKKPAKKQPADRRRQAR